MAGVGGRMLSAIQSLYTNVISCVRINGMFTDWFTQSTGLRQGCPLSPILFNLFINELAFKIQAIGKGIDVDNEKISILLYADDVVLLTENEDDLQSMLSVLSEWCGQNDMSVNCTKSNIVHFRPPSQRRTTYVFTCCNETLSIVDSYMYLGLLLNEFLDYNITTRDVAQSASRALGLLIAKSKALGGMPYKVFTKLYDTMVWPVISYGAALWGNKTYACINAVQNRAMRFYLGTGKYSPNAAVSGDMGWQPPVIRQWKVVCAYWYRVTVMAESRLNKRIFLWCKSKANRSCKNWYFMVEEMLLSIDLNRFTTGLFECSKNYFLSYVISKLEQKHQVEWFNVVQNNTGMRGKGGNKLRTYSLFKTTYHVEPYCQMFLPRKHRSELSKFRSGVAPLRLETGRYEGLEVDQRICPIRHSSVEDEKHVLLHCPLYVDFRNALFKQACEVNASFGNYTENEQLVFLFSTVDLTRSLAKTCFQILHRMATSLYK